MAHIFFARHGQNVWNVENKICGATDIELTQNGHEQAILLGNKIIEQNFHIDEILYSPLIRAAETARHISEVTGICMREELRLKEQNFGKYESTPRDGNEFKEAKTHFIDHYEGGESMFEMAQRIYNLLDDLKKEADKKVYLLVAHNGIARIVNSYFYDMSNEQFSSFGINNCEIVRYDFNDKVKNSDIKYAITKRCTSCGKCKNICPEHAIKDQKAELDTFVIDKELCTGCGKCIDNCPLMAIERM